ncbi:MAG: ATP-binding protein, partial [Mesorhizobium sp.]|nr:ATP-binding protein [Mesorhizobium sp.]
MRHTLFFKIYVTVLASIAIVAITSAIFVRHGMEERDMGWTDRRDFFISAMLPADADPVSQQVVIERLADAFRADVALFDRDGRLLAAAGRPIPARELDRLDDRQAYSVGGLFLARLEDGRALAARVRTPPGPRGRNPLAYLALVAAVTGIAAYPVVRHLTRRLEALRLGVEKWGEGDLGSRAVVGGKDEVAAVAASFNVAAGRVEALLAAHRTLLANASHELRSPLARLRLAIDLYEQAPLERTRAEIVQSLAELDELVEEVLLASRLDHTEAPSRLEPVDLLAVAAEEGARAGIDVHGIACLVDGDPRLLTRLVRNLVQNGLRHGKPPVTVEVAARSGVVELRVRDEGPGVPDGEAEKVFEPFYRPAGRSEAAGSWGLGLALVRQIAERHGATVRYEK